jgi:hypothetical protein
MAKVFKGQNRELVGGLTKAFIRASQAKSPEGVVLRGLAGFVEGANAQAPHRIKARAAASERNEFIGDITGKVIDAATDPNRKR